MATIEDALRYHQRGWTVIPIPLKEKGPRYQGWQKTRYEDETKLVELFRREWKGGEEGNVGVLLGETESNIVDADLDWMEATQLAKYFLPKTNVVFGRKSKPSSHFFYQVPGFGPTIKYQIAGDKGGTILELRSSGSQTVLPESVHPSEELIRFEVDEGMGVYEPRSLRRAGGYLAAACLLLRNWVPGVKDDLATAVAGALLRSDWDPEKVDKFIGIISTEAGDSNTSEKLKAQKLNDTLRSKQGHVPGVPRLMQLLGKPAVDLLIQWLELKKVEEGFPLQVLSGLDTFCSQHFAPLEYIVEGLLYSPSISMLFAPRGRGKTFVAIELALAIALGRKFLYWNVPSKRRVWYVDGEMPGSMLQERFKLLLRGSNAADAMLNVVGSEAFYRTTGETLVLNNIHHQQKLLSLIEEATDAGMAPDVIIFDNLSSMTSGVDENSNSEQDSLLHFLRDLRLSGTSTVLIHHSGKSGEQRGASRREDLLDLVIKLSAPEFITNEGCEFRFEFTKTRGISPHPHALEARLVEGEHGEHDWAMTDLAQAVKCPKWAEMLRLRVNNPGASNARLSELAGCSPGNVTQHLNKAEQLGYFAGGRATPEGIAYLRRVFIDHAPPPEEEGDEF